MHVREKPPLRLHEHVIAPNGRRYRWADDELDPSKVPSGRRHSSTIPGGHESHDVTLPRKPGIDYSDLERFSTIRLVGAGGDVAGEYRIERAPRVSGDQMAVSPSAVGWQAHLEDDKSAAVIFIDRDLSRWGGMGAARRAGLLANWGPQDGEVKNDQAVPIVTTEITGPWLAGSKGISEAWYDAGPGLLIGKILASLTNSPAVNPADPLWTWDMALSSDDNFGASDGSGDLQPTDPATASVTATAARRFGVLQLFYNGAAGADNTRYAIDWSNIRVIGDHGLTLRGVAPDEGLYDSDIWAYALRQWAPLLNFTEGADGTLRQGSFLIPHAAHYEPTTAGEIGRQANRFGLRDWAVWDDKTFYLYDRGTRGRKWRARSGPAKLEETGPQVDRLWSSILVQYQDVDGKTKTAGPPGSGADLESALLQDSDPANPANQIGAIRRDVLQMGTAVGADAIEVGARFLEESKLLDHSGKATIVGYILDDHGVIHPYWRIRAGDQIAFDDAADHSYRRIVKADHDDAARSCSVDLDAPPEGLQALLERLGVLLVHLGLT